MSFSAVVLPPDYPPPPTRREARLAALLLTRGRLKAFTHETGFGENPDAQAPWLNDRELAEAILERVPYVRMPVYEWIVSPLSDHPERPLEDWGREMESYAMRPMPDDVPHLPARVTAFTSHPWGRVGVFMVVFERLDMPVRWGLWYYQDPSAKSGSPMPFFRMGDYDDAELLAWLVLKPFLDARGVVIENLKPPASENYPGPWHRMGTTLRFREVPDWFSAALRER
ncbi:hypothetical protein ETQ85_24275 [Zoogloea oleivorans]|uniref:Uncharacterized protein n=1 Tax=Zoogloea oleivorans TaxID=1552750 RepID=A0A6C2CD10_9RHOO|nr:hypothetical protein [Zoogloea oleivorans]TYC51409.1 hypothetical protein ETQ85_24275 [Zoogloea oleivorans]